MSHLKQNKKVIVSYILPYRYYTYIYVQLYTIQTCKIPRFHFCTISNYCDICSLLSYIRVSFHFLFQLSFPPSALSRLSTHSFYYLGTCTLLRESPLYFAKTMEVMSLRFLRKVLIHSFPRCLLRPIGLPLTTINCLIDNILLSLSTGHRIIDTSLSRNVKTRYSGTHKL